MRHPRTIRVRIFAYYNAPRFVNGTEIIRDDLSEDFASIEAAVVDSDKNIHEEFEALVFAPFGGGRNYGAFHLPQMNERGVVSFLDGDFGKPLWVGSYFSPIRDDDFKITGVNIPNEDPSQEGTDTNGIKNGEFVSGVDDAYKGDKDTIIIRTKTTNSSSEDDMNWENVNTENIVALDDKKVRVRHSTEWENSTEKKFQEIMIYPDPDNSDKETVKLEVNNSSDNKSGILKLTEDGFKIELYEDGSVTNSFSITSEDSGFGINFYDEHGNKIIGDDNGIALSAKDETSTIIISGSEDMVEINGNADTIVLYTDLKKMLQKLSEHIHISSVPTTPPLDSKLAPLAPQFKKPIIDMEARKTKSEH